MLDKGVTVLAAISLLSCTNVLCELVLNGSKAFRRKGFNRAAGVELQEYLEERTSESEPPVAKSKQKNRERWDAPSYAHSIKWAIIIANRSLPPDQQIPHWTPYQLRHAGVTELTLENDGNLDVARAVAGQRSLAIAQGYNHADLKIAIEQAKKRKRPPESPEVEGIVS